jgi:hypothetical protein
MLLNRFFASSLLLITSVAFAQAPQIKSGSTVYIEPMGGYETYLAAAFTKKHVPLIVVADKAKAEYIITSTVAHKDLSGGQPAVVVNNSNTNITNGDANGDTAFNRGQEQAQQRAAARDAQRRALGETSASIAILNPQTSQIVFAYSAGKMGTNQLQKTAEDCAKHLKESIEKPKK